MNSSIIDRPWGTYEDFYRDTQVVFKRLIIKPKQAISYQVHRLRDETWFIEQGEGSLKTSIAGDPALRFEVEPVLAGQLVMISRDEYHQVRNIGTTDLVIWEMQSGECKEEDIERLEDQYGRT